MCSASPASTAGRRSAAEYEQFAGRTDAGGTHYLQIEFDGPEVDLPSTITAEATVLDVDRQAWASRTDLLVHPARYYVGLRSDRTFVEQGTPMRYDAVVTDVDGNAVAGPRGRGHRGPARVGLRRRRVDRAADRRRRRARSRRRPTRPTARCGASSRPTVGGTYRITAVVTDDTGHRNRTESTQWVSGGVAAPPAASSSSR